MGCSHGTMRGYTPNRKITRSGRPLQMPVLQCPAERQWLQAAKSKRHMLKAWKVCFSVFLKLGNAVFAQNAFAIYPRFLHDTCIGHFAIAAKDNATDF